jgi:hypothetical protein
MELQYREGALANGLGEKVDLEDVYLFPLWKGTQLARGTPHTERWLIVPQRNVGEDTRAIQTAAPKTWRYLMAHADRLDSRASSIYRRRPRFSVFGIGEYTFAPWKVAVSGFHKKLEFVKVGCFGGKPIVLDDTSYYLACRDEREADHLLSLLNSDIARDFFSAFVFWDAKRPVTCHLLQLLDLGQLARECEGVSLAAAGRPERRKRR